MPAHRPYLSAAMSAAHALAKASHASQSRCVNVDPKYLRSYRFLFAQQLKFQLRALEHAFVAQRDGWKTIIIGRLTTVAGD